VKAGVAYHAVERRALFGAGPGYALIGIDFIKLPVVMLCYIFTKVPLLTFKGIYLVAFIGGYAAVCCNLQPFGSLLIF